jgi:hypothetical protein
LFGKQGYNYSLLILVDPGNSSCHGNNDIIILMMINNLLSHMGKLHKVAPSETLVFARLGFEPETF